VLTLRSFQSVVELEPGEPWWPQEGVAIRAALIDHFGDGLPGDALPPPLDAAAPRARLRAAAPSLAAFTDRVRVAFDIEGACAVLVPRFGLARACVDDQGKP